MEQFTGEIRAIRQVAEGTWTIDFDWPSSQTPLPGHFFTIRHGSGTDPLLRRPFAFSGFDPRAGAASFIFLTRGRSTHLLSSLAPGAQLDILGPLGRGFGLGGDGRAVLLSGGIGLGPILFLDAALAERGRDRLFLFGARTAGLVPASVLPPSAVLCTDDGSLGEKGTVLDAVSRRGWKDRDEVFACGPGPMLRAVARDCLSASRACQVSVEQHMACGVGACMGCAVRAAGGGYLRACADGPVFDAKELSWE